MRRPSLPSSRVPEFFPAVRCQWQVVTTSSLSSPSSQVQRSDWGWRRRPAWSQVEPGCARSVWVTVCLCLVVWWAGGGAQLNLLLYCCRHWALVIVKTRNKNLQLGRGEMISAVIIRSVSVAASVSCFSLWHNLESVLHQRQSGAMNSFQLNLSCKFWLRVLRTVVYCCALIETTADNDDGYVANLWAKISTYILAAR